MANEPSRIQRAWWHSALTEFMVEARVRLRRSYPSIANTHDDLVGETSLALTTVLTFRQGTTLASWFETNTPPQEDVQRFRQLAFTVLNRRIADQFRSQYRNWTDSLEDLPALPEQPDHLPDAGTTLDLRRAVVAVLRLVLNLPDQDRDLLQQVMLDTGDSPMSDSDRQRLSRLRVRLLRRLRDELQQDPMDMLKSM